MTLAAKFQLHPFQQRGAEWVAARRFAYLADEMGVGKTPQLAKALDISGARRALIIAPAIIEDDWRDTLLDFTPNRPPAHCLRDPANIPTTGDVICSYNRAEMHREALSRTKWDVLICDEASALKTPGAQRTRAIINPIYGGRRSIAASCGAVWWADGTPISKDLGDLWPMLRVSGLFDGKYWSFIDLFAETHEQRFGPGPHDVKKVIGKNAKNPAALTALLKGFMLVRTQDEVLPELPPMTLGTLNVPGEDITGTDPILPVLRQLDADAHDAIMASIDANNWKMDHVPHLATIRRLTGLAKATMAADIARLELECGLHEKVVLFGLHSDVLQYLRHELRDFDPIMLTGAESHTKRRKSIREFQTGRPRVAIGQSAAAGAGITLTASNRLINVEPGWTWARNSQVYKRVHRFGQHKPCRVDDLALAGSSDAKVIAAVRARKHVANRVLTTELTG